MAVDTKSYLQELARQAGLDAETISAMEKALENEKFAASLGNSVSRQSDYSRNMDTFKQQQQEFDRQKEEWKAWHQGVMTADQQREAELQALRQRVGVPDPNANPNQGLDAANYVSRKDYEIALRDMEARALNTSVAIAKDAMSCQMDYYTRFGKPLDLDALEKYAVEHKVTVRNAYNEMIAPEVQAKQTAEWEKKLADARTDGAREALSKHNLPTEAAKSEPHLLYDDLNRKAEDRAALNTDRSRINSFRDAWDNYQPSSAPKT